jgi:hypothetical protein
VEEPIQVRYDWGTEREAALPQMAPVLLGELMPPAWLQYLVPFAYLLLLLVGLGLGGPWVGLVLVLIPLLLVGALRARRLLSRPEPPAPQPFRDDQAEPWVFTVSEDGIEWRSGDRLVQTATWADVARCHRAATGFVLCFTARSPLHPVWLPAHAFPDPEQVEQFAEVARRKARLYTLR